MLGTTLLSLRALLPLRTLLRLRTLPIRTLRTGLIVWVLPVRARAPVLSASVVSALGLRTLVLRTLLCLLGAGEAQPLIIGNAVVVCGRNGATNGLVGPHGVDRSLCATRTSTHLLRCGLIKGRFANLEAASLFCFTCSSASLGLKLGPAPGIGVPPIPSCEETEQQCDHKQHDDHRRDLTPRLIGFLGDDQRQPSNLCFHVLRPGTKVVCVTGVT